MVIELCRTFAYGRLRLPKRIAEQRVLSSHYQSVVLVWLIPTFCLDFYFKQNELIVKTGEINQNIYIPKEGIYRGFLYQGGKETTLYFGMEGDIVASIYSYYRGEPSVITIEACCDSVIMKISKQDIDKLIHESVEFANWSLNVTLQQLYGIERKRTVIVGNAYERYNSFVKKRAALLQKVPLRIIASYLGITQQSLSRLRNPRYKNNPSDK